MVEKLLLNSDKKQSRKKSADVFSLYFNGMPPFAPSGNKKNEFPDAFVFYGAKKYLENHPNDILLFGTGTGLDGLCPSFASELANTRLRSALPRAGSSPIYSIHKNNRNPN